MNSYQMNLNVPTAHSLYPRATEKGTDKLYPSIKILVLPKYFDKLEFRLPIESLLKSRLTDIALLK